MIKIQQIYLLSLLISIVNGEELINELENNNSRKSDSIQVALELGAKTNFWTPGISGNVLDYKTEGLYLGFGKLKLKIYNSDVFTLEKYETFSQTKNQQELLATYQDDRKHESSIDGIRVTLQLMKVVNFLFDKEWLTGLNYEFNTRNFLGDATLLQNSKYWYGQINKGVDGVDYSRIEVGTNLAFKTKFTSHKLSYQFEDAINFAKGDYLSLGLFDEEWSKPTFVGDTLLGEEPLIFDSNYYVQGLSSSIGVKTDKYHLETYIDYGLKSEMDIIQKGENNYASLNKDTSMYRVGAKGNYKFKDIYNTNFFTTDVILGAEMQYSQLTQDGSAIDAETLYGVNAGIEITF